MGIGGNRQGRAVQQDATERVAQLMHQPRGFLQVQEFQWIDRRLARRHYKQIAISDSSHGLMKIRRPKQIVADSWTAMDLKNSVQRRTAEVEVAQQRWIVRKLRLCE